VSELRHDPLSRRWVIIAGERAPLPEDYPVPAPSRTDPASCPLCEGHEGRTSPEIDAVRGDTAPNGPGWRVRVVPNRRPVLAIEGQPDRRGVGVYDRMHGIGAHELIVESPRHDVALQELPPADLAAVIGVFRARIADLHRDTRFKYVLLSRNHGAAAGALLSHPHSQLIATPVTPHAVAVELDSSRLHHHVKERCLLCDIVAQEIEDGRRIVSLTDDFVAFCPYASRFPFEVTLAPRGHSHDFGQIPDGRLPSFAAALADVLSRLTALLRDPPYNLVLHSAPNINVRPKRSGYFSTLEDDWHWHVEILPRLSRVAGFEWGSGLHVNTMPPEEAARMLREITDL